MPLAQFIRNGVLFDLTKEIVQFCFYTSTSDNDNNINKENPDVKDGPSKCGPFINVPPPITRGVKFDDLKIYS